MTTIIGITLGITVILLIVCSIVCNYYRKELKKQVDIIKITTDNYVEALLDYINLSSKYADTCKKYSELEVKIDELERDYNIALDTISQLQLEKKEILLDKKAKK